MRMLYLFCICHSKSLIVANEIEVKSMLQELYKSWPMLCFFVVVVFFLFIFVPQCTRPTRLMEQLRHKLYVFFLLLFSIRFQMRLCAPTIRKTKNQNDTVALPLHCQCDIIINWFRQGARRRLTTRKISTNHRDKYTQEYTGHHSMMSANKQWKKYMKKKKINGIQRPKMMLPFVRTKRNKWCEIFQQIYF